jgi:MerR family transcriptional regulator, light-induced transcriptional regulator
MNLLNETPTYNLKVVIQETGVKPDTLRAWERRYGLPQPDRTTGGHRLYSQRDIETIKWLLARQEEGLSISRAVRLWKSLEKEGQNPLQTAERQATEAAPRPPVLSGPALTEIRDAWVNACLNFDEATAEHTIAQAFALYRPELVCIEVLQKGLARIGELWYVNQATVQQEHFASALAMRRLNALLAAAPAPTRAGRVLIACPPEEDHTFAPLLLAMMLRYRGWDVLYLGANVPLARLETTIQAVQPHLVVLTAQQLNTAASLLLVANFLRTLAVPLAFGGRIFNRLPDLRGRIPGHFLGEQLADAGQMVEQLMTNKTAALPPTTPLPTPYREALVHYRQRQAVIEGEVWQRLQTAGMPYERMTTANIHLARDITAALTLGDMAFLQPELVWVETLIINYDESADMLRQYIRAYYEAAQIHLDERGSLIIDWLAQVNANHAGE